MIHDVISAEYRGAYNIEVVFDDGKSGIVDFTIYLRKGGVYDLFQSLEFFKRFEVNRELGVLTWEGGVDIAPETLYSEATGSPLPDWMTPDEEKGDRG